MMPWAVFTSCCSILQYVARGGIIRRHIANAAYILWGIISSFCACSSLGEKPAVEIEIQQRPHSFGCPPLSVGREREKRLKRLRGKCKDFFIYNVTNCDKTKSW